MEPLIAALAQPQEPLPELDDLPEIGEVEREIILDRLEAGYAERLFDITVEQFGDILACVLPEDFRIVQTNSPSQSPPGSPGRIDDYCTRAMAGGQIHIKGDACTVRNDSLAIEGRHRANGTGVRNIGWVSHWDTQGPRIEAGMYRDAGGVWFDIEDDE